ncbi:MAG: DUF5615 family PIN-like protein [Prosthecobacter sp.]|uniref:DUF5615 family PIN-like protein n=1 Tax=Prosthecobacter sp. TaxID=1965333 RepID=UPI003901B4AF
MNFLLDANMPRRCLDVIRRHGHKVEHARDIGMGTSPDADIATHVRAHCLALVTRDLDFADVRVYRPEDYHGLLILRLPDDAVAEEIAGIMERFFGHEPWLLSLPGRLCILEEARVRFRPPI